MKELCAGDIYKCKCHMCHQQLWRINRKNNLIRKPDENVRFAEALRHRGEPFEIDNSRISFMIIDGKVIRI